MWCTFFNEYDLSAIFDRSYDCTFILVVVGGMYIDKHFLNFLFFLFFSAVVVVGLVSLGLGGDSAYFANIGVSMVLAVVLLVEKAMVLRSGGFTVIIGSVWYLGVYLLVSFT